MAKEHVKRKAQICAQWLQNVKALAKHTSLSVWLCKLQFHCSQFGCHAGFWLCDAAHYGLLLSNLRFGGFFNSISVDLPRLFRACVLASRCLGWNGRRCIDWLPAWIGLAKIGPRLQICTIALLQHRELGNMCLCCLLFDLPWHFFQAQSSQAVTSTWKLKDPGVSDWRKNFCFGAVIS